MLRITRNVQHYSPIKVEFKKPLKSEIVNFELLKWLGLLVPLLGTQAWIAGAAFEAGYWGVVGLDGPIVPKTLQQTALIGFIGAFPTWAGAVMVIAMFGAILGISTISVKRNNSKEDPRIIQKIKAWVSRSFFINDKKIGLTSVVIIFGAIAFFTFLLLPMAFWSLYAHQYGKNFFNQQMCSVQRGAYVRTTAQIAGGDTFQGLLIDRSDKFTVILGKSSIHVLTAGDISKLQYTIKLPNASCTEN